LDKKSEIEKEHGFKCLTKMAETMGIFPTHTQSSVMINILNQQLVPEVTKEVHGLQAFIDGQWAEVLTDDLSDNKDAETISIER
jgi:hypothetical protein